MRWTAERLTGRAKTVRESFDGSKFDHALCTSLKGIPINERTPIPPLVATASYQQGWLLFEATCTHFFVMV
jgi:hypothetical protein